MKLWLSAALIWAASYGWVRAGVHLGAKHLPRGLGYPRAGGIQTDLFRFDSLYYLDIARHGYAYGGDPASSPNVVFAPLFPLLVRATSYLGLPDVAAGFWLNEIMLFAALGLWLGVLRDWVGDKKAARALLLMATSAGAYAFHAFYAESAMLLGLAVMARGLDRGRASWTAIGAAWVGASRTAAMPFAACAALVLLRGAVKRRSVASALFAAVALVGVAGYLGFIGSRFGPPFALLKQIQESSWAKFHPPDFDAGRIVNFDYVIGYAHAAWARPWVGTGDIRGWNLLWMMGGLIAAVWGVARRRDALAWSYAGYAVFIYASGAASEYLISAHRLMVVMIPLFVMLAEIPAIPIVVVAVNAALGLLHAASFNQGIWFWF